MTTALKEIRGERREVKNKLAYLSTSMSFIPNAPVQGICDKMIAKTASAQAQFVAPKSYTPNLVTSEQLLGRKIKMK